ncbi:MAG: DNA polymerase domain-containing protein [Candidatus Methylomirabilales bacterium]
MNPLDLPLETQTILFGHDHTPGFTCFEVEEGNRIRAYRKVGDAITSVVQPFTPFCLIAHTNLLTGLTVGHTVEELAGEAWYRYLVRFASLADLAKARNHFQKISGRTPMQPDAPYLVLNDPIQQHLMLTGQTHFLGLTFRDLKRLQLDIEVYTQSGFEFPNAARDADRIIAIALSDSTGWEEVLSGKALDEKALLEEMCQRVRDRDPDVIEGHNCFRFDLEYIEARAARLGVKLCMGRDGSILRGHPSRTQIGERTITYRKYEIHGRHIVDTWILAQHYDVSARDLESYGLKEVARHFNLSVEDRTTLSPDRIPWHFDHDPGPLLAYALDDVRETRALSALLSPSYFTQAQIFPFSYQNTVLRGNATKIDALLMREYLRRRESIPAPSPGQEVAGGYTEIRYQGVARNVLHWDVTSLYPSIMLRYGCFPAKDRLGVFAALLKDLTTYRIQAKAAVREASNGETRLLLQTIQSTFKILINSFYGYLGFSMGHFNDFAQANRITATGRDLIRQIMAWLEAKGCRIIQVDTDGLYFTLPEGVPTHGQALLAELTETLPDGIHLEEAGRYPAMFSYKMKNYALLDSRGRLGIKGSGLRSRGLELFQRQWMQEMMSLVLQGKGSEVEALTQRYLRDFERHAFDVKTFMKTETLQDSLDTYQQKVKGKKRNAAAPYELALRAERRYEPGDQISYYVTGSNPRVKVHEAAKLAAQWNPAAPDENVAYYQAKLLELYKKFKPLIEKD